MRVLFVGAHPDDIEQYAGGTAALYAQSGAEIFFCIATNGNIGSSAMSRQEIMEIRHAEALAGAKVIGAEVIWLGFDDEFLFDDRPTRLAFIEAFRYAAPDVVFCHWKDDYNIDHSTSAHLVDACLHMASVPLIETRSPPVDKIPHVYFMDTQAGIGFEPEVYVDTTSVFATKVKMLGKHVSQNRWMTDLYGVDLSAFLEIPDSFRGLQAGCRFAEAFRCQNRWGRTFTRHHLPMIAEEERKERRQRKFSASVSSFVASAEPSKY